MRRFQHPLRTGISALLVCGWLVCGQRLAQADTSAPSLGISQLKVTSSSGQLITLYNSTATAQDLSKYQLEYFNNYDVSKATSSKLIALSGTLPPHSYYIISDGTLTMCFQATVDSVTLGLSSTAGMLELLSFSQSLPGGLLQAVVQDYVAWSKTAASGVETLPSSVNGLLVRQPQDANGSPQIKAPGAGSWLSVQPDLVNPCGLVSVSNQPIQSGPGQLLPSQEPTATIVGLVKDSATAPSIPDADNGLMEPKITELLPNPDGSGNDATDEFIELFNPNASPFDLSGFKLQTGITSTHSYIFPAGTSLAASSFTAYYSNQTRLSLSNSSGQATLLDPLGNTIGQTEAYRSADDGLAWALANGKWYWSTTPTPGAANIIKQIASANNKAKSKSSPSTKTAKASPSHTKSFTAASSTANSGDSTPVQSWLLALIGVIALIYGAYEYRQDLANRIHQLRSYFKTGQDNRRATKRRRGD